MTRASLSSGQRRTLEIIEALRFGAIEHLAVLNGEPHYDPGPRIVEEVKLSDNYELHVGSGAAGPTLKKEFENLFNQLSHLNEVRVTIEVRHSLPFKLVLERSHTELCQGAK
jgi:hypothetical protein